MAIFVTGGAGFIGSQFVRDWVGLHPDQPLVNFDKLTYAGNLDNLAEVATSASYRFVRGDICDAGAVAAAMPDGCDAVVHFAAESHVDRSILAPPNSSEPTCWARGFLLDAAAPAACGASCISPRRSGRQHLRAAYRQDSHCPQQSLRASKAAAKLVERRKHFAGRRIHPTANNYGPSSSPKI
jgi:dTDP-glucose 4,6-dehydratase